MSIYYQLGQVIIAKDLVFGWMIGRAATDHWYMVSDCPSDVLLDLCTANLPEYLSDFKKDCREKYLPLAKSREKQQEIIKQELKEIERQKEERKRIAEKEERLKKERKEQRQREINHIAECIVLGTQYGHPATLKGGDGHIYCRVHREHCKKNDTSVYSVFNSHTGELLCVTESVLDAAKKIAKRWW